MGSCLYATQGLAQKLAVNALHAPKEAVTVSLVQVAKKMNNVGM